MPSRETADLLFYLKMRDWNQIKFLLKKFFTDKYYRKIIILDTISTKFWKKVPHTHKIWKFEDEGYCFCTRCQKSWDLEDWIVEERDHKIDEILNGK
jgi:hypothetical protein